MADLFQNIARTQDAYSAKDIEVLEGLEPVRRRPGMYIGGTDERALHHLVAEILDNSMDEAVAGHATRIDIFTMAKAEKRRALCFLRLESAAQEQQLMAGLGASRFGEDLLVIVDLAN